MTRPLNALEQRVLGVLLEKSLSQPSQYPLSVNALLLGCNQKQNREPVMGVTEAEVSQTLTYLMVRGIVTEFVPGQGGGRVNRYGHEAQTHYGWQRRSIAVMAELLLRGPQTVGELRSRCARMVAFEDIDAVRIVLASLERLDPPFVETLPREPGKSVVRHRHLLGSDHPAVEAAQPAGTEPPARAAVETTDAGRTENLSPASAVQPAEADTDLRLRGKLDSTSGKLDSLSGKLDFLSDQLNTLRDQLADLTGRVDDLEGML